LPLRKKKAANPPGVGWRRSGWVVSYMKHSHPAAPICREKPLTDGETPGIPEVPVGNASRVPRLTMDYGPQSERSSCFSSRLGYTLCGSFILRPIHGDLGSPSREACAPPRRTGSRARWITGDRTSGIKSRKQAPRFTANHVIQAQGKTFFQSKASQSSPTRLPADLRVNQGELDRTWVS
jgi:hypothetical protein